jgi:pyruvate/2-oxoglutarate dehydrogenase complex dihydrolipoamide acyltransferase (E2) component
MRHQVTMPKLGDTTQCVLISRWLCEVGDWVEAGSPLMEVETDKVTAEVPAPVSGRIAEISFGADDEVSVGEVFCTIES